MYMYIDTSANICIYMCVQYIHKYIYLDVYMYVYIYIHASIIGKNCIYIFSSINSHLQRKKTVSVGSLSSFTKLLVLPARPLPVIQYHILDQKPTPLAYDWVSHFGHSPGATSRCLSNIHVNLEYETVYMFAKVNLDTLPVIQEVALHELMKSMRV